MPEVNAQQVEAWIRDYVTQHFDVTMRTIESAQTFDQLGLDSLSAVNLAGELEDWLTIEIDPALPYDYPTLTGFSAQVARLVNHAKAAAVG